MDGLSWKCVFSSGKRAAVGAVWLKTCQRQVCAQVRAHCALRGAGLGRSRGAAPRSPPAPRLWSCARNGKGCAHTRVCPGRSPSHWARRRAGGTGSSRARQSRGGAGEEKPRSKKPGARRAAASLKPPDCRGYSLQGPSNLFTIYQLIHMEDAARTSWRTVLFGLIDSSN